MHYQIGDAPEIAIGIILKRRTMNEENALDQFINQIKHTSLSSQNTLESETLSEITNHPSKQLKKDPFWDELVEICDK
ncbi:hypothetical protein C2G38_2234740 [Gigaspora rosea]|uniref:Uncharacterized protein n=1 Tax=Gigaspora rosea TaxID=44941 RepID=A0A397TVC3_9GLOM|nr:hypothetical protein C2G38_2234740 [Gigaspora rosea]